MDTILLKNKASHLIVHEYNTTKTVFKNGVEKYKKTSFSKYKGRGKKNSHNGTLSPELLELKTKEYLKNVKSNILNLAFNYSNWEYFITLTFDFREVGEYSHEKAIDMLKKWLNLQRKQNKDMVYLLVPEFHKSGHLHFHGLISNVPHWIFEEARYPKTNRLIKVNGLQIYNLKNYKLGFTTISKIQSQEKVSNYISKYATKDLITLKNKKRYWYSRNLEKPKTDYLFLKEDLLDYLENKNITFTKNIKKENCCIELASTSLHNINYAKLNIKKNNNLN